LWNPVQSFARFATINVNQIVPPLLKNAAGTEIQWNFNGYIKSNDLMSPFGISVAAHEGRMSRNE
jgi:hypothetical protein